MWGTERSSNSLRVTYYDGGLIIRPRAQDSGSLGSHKPVLLAIMLSCGPTAGRKFLVRPLWLQLETWGTECADKLGAAEARGTWLVMRSVAHLSAKETLQNTGQLSLCYLELLVPVLPMPLPQIYLSLVLVASRKRWST